MLTLPWPRSDRGKEAKGLSKGQGTSLSMVLGSRDQEISHLVDKGSRDQEISRLVDQGSKDQEISHLVDQGSREQEISPLVEPGSKEQETSLVDPDSRQMMSCTAGCAIPEGYPEKSFLRMVWETLHALNSLLMTGTG